MGHEPVERTLLAQPLLYRSGAAPVASVPHPDSQEDGNIESGVGKARRKVGEAVRDVGNKLGK